MGKSGCVVILSDLDVGRRDVEGVVSLSEIRSRTERRHCRFRGRVGTLWWEADDVAGEWEMGAGLWTGIHQAETGRRRRPARERRRRSGRERGMWCDGVFIANGLCVVRGEVMEEMVVVMVMLMMMN